MSGFPKSLPWNSCLELDGEHFWEFLRESLLGLFPQDVLLACLLRMNVGREPPTTSGCRGCFSGTPASKITSNVCRECVGTMCPSTCTWVLHSEPPHKIPFSFTHLCNKCLLNIYYALYTSVDIRWLRRVSLTRWHCSRDLRDIQRLGGQTSRWRAQQSAKALKGGRARYVRATAGVSGVARDREHRT